MFVIVVRLSAPIAQLQDKILKRDGVKAWGPRLLRSNCRVLEKERTLASYNIGMEHTVILDWSFFGQGEVL